MRSFVLLAVLCCLFLAVPAPDVQAQAHAARWSWMRTPADADQWALLDGTLPAGRRQVGVLEAASGVYTPYDRAANQWGRPCEPPAGAGLPPGCRLRLPPTGVIEGKLHHSGSHITRGGHQISKQEALATLAGKPLVGGGKPMPMDGGKRRVNVIGSAAKCAAAMAAAGKHAEFDATEFRPDAWQITRQGFLATADPTIYVQEPDGTVIRRLDGYEGDAAFEAVLSEIATGHRVRPNPEYDGTKDAGWLARIKPWLSWGVGGVPWIPLALTGALLGFALWSYRKKV